MCSTWNIACNICDFNSKYKTVKANTKKYVNICEKHGPSPGTASPGATRRGATPKSREPRFDPIGRGPLPVCRGDAIRPGRCRGDAIRPGRRDPRSGRLVHRLTATGWASDLSRSATRYARSAATGPRLTATSHRLTATGHRPPARGGRAGRFGTRPAGQGPA